MKKIKCWQNRSKLHDIVIDQGRIVWGCLIATTSGENPKAVLPNPLPICASVHKRHRRFSSWCGFLSESCLQKCGVEQRSFQPFHLTSILTTCNLEPFTRKAVPTCFSTPAGKNKLYVITLGARCCGSIHRESIAECLQNIFCIFLHSLNVTTRRGSNLELHGRYEERLKVK